MTEFWTILIITYSGALFDGATAAQKVVWNTKEYAVLGVVDPDGTETWLEWRISDGVAS